MGKSTIRETCGHIDTLGDRLTRVYKINGVACHFLFYSVYSQEQMNEWRGWRRNKMKENWSKKHLSERLVNTATGYDSTAPLFHLSLLQISLSITFMNCSGEYWAEHDGIVTVWSLGVEVSLSTPTPHLIRSLNCACVGLPCMWSYNICVRIPKRIAYKHMHIHYVYCM